MSKAKQIIVKESLKELIQLKKNASYTINKRILMLIEIKKNRIDSLSKRSLAIKIGVDPNSITNWKKLYEQQGIKGLIADKRIGFKPSLISEQEHKLIEAKLKNPKNGIRGYTELLEWVNTELSKDLKYITLLKYTERHFGTKIKVARKSHVKKDVQAVEAFKKTSLKNAKK